MILAYVLTAWSVYVYIFYKTRSRWGAFLAGVLTAFLPYHYAHLHTIHKSMFLALPLSLWSLERFIETRKLLFSLTFSLVVVFQIACTWYLTVLLVIFYLFYIAYILIFHRRAILNKKLIPALILAALIILPAGLFFARPYIEVNRMFSWFERGINTQPTVSPKMYLTTGENNLLYGHFLKGAIPSEKPLRTFFPGFLLYGLGITGMYLYIRRPNCRSEDRIGTGWFLIVFGLLSMLFALGPFLRTDGGKFPLPFYLLYHSLPFMKALRGPQDFVLIFYFTLLFFSAICVKSLIETAKKWRKATTVIVLVIIALAESLKVPFPVVKLPYGDAIPSCYRWASRQEEKTVVATYYAHMRKDNLSFMILKHYAMYYSIFHFCRIPEGHTAYVPPVFLDYQQRAGNFPDREAIDAFAEVGVQFILVDLRGNDQLLRRRVIEVLEAAQGIEITEIFDDSLVLKVI